MDQEHGTHGNYFYYLATAPSFFLPVIHKLGDAGAWWKKASATGAG